ncbi:MAG: hypothetical protein LBU65_12930 [Planctomycetaceae bacterium]|jgi:prophage antirepressor-like protein|nr:hypothetical protein [Planctomycetaceae bacterium]
MNDLIIFNYAGSPVRIVDRDNNLWFVAKDIAEQLGYSNTSSISQITKKVTDTIIHSAL